MRSTRNHIRGTVLCFVSLFVLIVLLLPPRHAGAQIASETIELAGGESKIITASFPDEYEDRHYKDIGIFHKGGGDLGGFIIYARANGKFSRKYCEVKLSIIAGGAGEIVFDQSADWSDWVSVAIPAGTNAAVVMYEAMEYQGGGIGCGSGTADIEIKLAGQEPITITPTNTRIPITLTIPPVQIPTTSTPLRPAKSNINFWADTYNLKRSECTTIHWDVSNATVYWNGDSAPTHNSAKVDGICPSQTKTYTLEVLGLDGQWHNQSLTIYVEEPIPTIIPTVTLTPTHTPIPDCDPTGKLGMILIVTDSNYLAVSTGDSNSWGKVKDALKQYYEPAMVECEGKPVFLDMALQYPQGGYTFVEVKQAISSELQQWRIGVDGRSPLAAIAIIGGPDVIPMPHLPDPTGLEDWIASDDFYADLISDTYQNIDTVITRLPDGHSTDLMLNYIAALAFGAEPPEGGVVLGTLQTSAHRLNIGPDYKPGLNLNDDDLLYLDDLVKDKAGSVIYLISPVWSIWPYNPSAVDQKLIRVDDLVNSMGINAVDVGTMLNAREILFHGLLAGSDPTSTWYARNAAPASTFITAYDAQVAQSIPAGTHVFALLPHSADLSRGDHQAYDTIPLAMLNSGAHHYIGLTGSMFLDMKNLKPYNGSPNVFADIGITKYSGSFAQYYYRARSEDPATSFWTAKNEYAREQGLSTPWDYKTYHSFIYYGLPEKGRYPGIYQGVDYVSLPVSSYNPLKPLKGCPSGDVNNCDGDTLPDSVENYLVETFKPYLIFDENEKVWNGNNPFATYWQVSPATLDGHKGAYITLVMTYPRDWGIHDIDRNGIFGAQACRLSVTANVVTGIFDECINNNWFKPWESIKSCGKEVGGDIAGILAVDVIDVADWLGELVNINPGSVFFGHAGDTEAIRLFVAEPGSGPLPQGSITDIKSNWSLTHIDWKRHKESFGSPNTIGKLVDDGMGINSTHPVVFVSENKHAMYPDYGKCEGYTLDVGDEFSQLKGCKVKFEDCGGPNVAGFRYDLEYIPFTPPTHNVGEEEQVARIGELQPVVLPPFHTLEDLSPDFACENAWSTQSFCGGLGGGNACDPLVGSGGLLDELCAGGLGKMWYGPSNDPYDQ